MSLLERLTNPPPHCHSHSHSHSIAPIILNSDEILLNLTPTNPNSSGPIIRTQGWKVSDLETQIIELGAQFETKLKKNVTKYQNPNTKYCNEFIELLTNFLQKIGSSIGVNVEKTGANDGKNYCCSLVEKFWFTIGEELGGLMLEVCVSLEIWELVESLIVSGVRGKLSNTSWIMKLVEKEQSELLCVCVKYVYDVGSDNLLAVLRCFLAPMKKGVGFDGMVKVRKEWEERAVRVVESIKNGKGVEGSVELAREASVLVMIAYDGFSSAELCMHYLFVSEKLDELTLSYAFSRLDGKEMLKLLKYLGKWLRKYERFPQALPCVNPVNGVVLSCCDGIPSLVSIVKVTGILFDERFSSLVLSAECHEELRKLEGIVKTLAAEARFCYLVADLVKNLNSDM